MRRLSPLWLLCLVATPGLAATAWQGRSLASVIEELRATGLPIVYSSQLVRDDYLISNEPAGTLQVDRLQRALTTFGLTLKTLDDNQGYAVVRATSPDSIASNTPNAGNRNGIAPLEEVTVIASRYQLGRDDSLSGHTLSSNTLPQATIEQLAGAQQDALRSVQYLPGVASNLSSLSHVRGGYEDENLIRFDGVELFKPVHFKHQQGLFGMLDPSWTQAVTFYSGAYPVNYGNHNAAVLDIAPRQSDSRAHELTASMLYTQWFDAGSYHDRDGHWLAGYRRSMVEQVLRHSEKQLGEPEFEDLLLHHSYQFTAGELRLGLLRLNDDISLHTDNGAQQADANDHDTYIWASWQDRGELNSTTQFSRAALSNQRDAAVNRIALNQGSLQDVRSATVYSLTQQLDWQTAHSQWQSGVELQYSRAQANYHSSSTYLAPLRDTFGLPSNQQISHEWRDHNLRAATFLDAQRSVGQWQLQAGVRVDHYSEASKALYVSPRATLQYAFSEVATGFISAGRYVQQEPLAQRDSDNPTNAPVEALQQLVLGYHTRLNSWLWRIETYDKRGGQQRMRAQNWLGLLSLANELELDRYQFNAARSRAQGVELTLSSAADSNTDTGTATTPSWWLSYSYSRAQDWSQTAAYGRYQPRTWDQPHAFSAGALWQLHRWQLSSTLSVHSGWTYTPLHIANDTLSSATLGVRNSARLNHFAALQLRAEYLMPLPSMQLNWSLELRNALNRHNDCCAALNIDQNGAIQVGAVQGFALIPVLGVTAKF